VSIAAHLVEPGSLCVGELLILHRLLEPARLLPEEALPGGEVGALEERVLEDALHAAERLDHVGTVVVEVPQLKKRNEGERGLGLKVRACLYIRTLT